MIIDMRVRPPLPPWTSRPQFQQGNYYPARAGFRRPAASLQQSIDLLFREMDEAEVRWGVISGRQAKEPLGVLSNDDIASVLRTYPDRFVGLAAIPVDAPADAAVAEIDRWLALPGFRGIVIEPAAAVQPMLLDDRRLYPIYRVSEPRARRERARVRCVVLRARREAQGDVRERGAAVAHR